MAAKFFKSTQVYLQADPRFNSKLVAKIVNNIMKDGKKSVAFSIFYDAIEIVKKRLPDKDSLEVVKTAINNVKPQIEVRSKRVGGATYQVPMEIKKNRQQTLAIRWILEAAQKKKGRPMAERLAGELLDAYNKEGAAITVKENVHKMAEANKAFAHFAW